MPLTLNNRNGDSNDSFTHENNNFERIEASVKWYSPQKSYGFLIQDNGSEDIMIHFSVLDTVGCPYLKEGDRVVCDIGPGKCGLHVIRVIDVKFESPQPRSLSDLLSPALTEDLEEVEGTIKWYKADKGYGFIIPDDGTREIFCHYTVVHRAGYKFLKPGLRVVAKVAQSERGPEARQITILCEGKEREVG